ncbi:MAG: hypothetical protein ABWX94_00045 [Candidatus Saccharimonadales bacterium]
MIEVMQGVELYTQELPRANAERPVKWICIDDRPALVDGLYRQTAGGQAGVGEDIANAVAMSKNSTNTIEDIPTQVVGNIAGKSLRYMRQGVELLLHRGCAAELQALAIREIQITNDSGQQAELFERSVQIYPELTSSKFEQAQEMKARARILPPDEAIPHLEYGRAWRKSANGLYGLNPTKRVALVDSPHVSATMLTNWRTEVAFDSRAAFTAPQEQKMPAYHASFGDMIPEIAEPLRNIFDFEVGDFLAATAIRHAAVSMALPPPENHSQINNYNIAA